MRVLIVVHGFPPTAQGGTELYAEAHAHTLARSHGDDVLVLARENDALRPELSVREEWRDGYRVSLVNHTFRDSTSIEDAWRAPRVARVVAPVIDAFAPDVAHVHHLTCLSTLIPSMLAVRGIPVVMTLHDYWLLCHRGQLLDDRMQRCDGPGEAGCARCLGPIAAAPQGPLGAQVVRAVARVSPHLAASLRGAARVAARTFASAEPSRSVSLARATHVRTEVLPHIDVFLAPSAHMRNRLTAFGADGTRIRVAAHGLAPALHEETRTPSRDGRPAPPASPLRAGFLGSLLASKAPHLAMRAVARLPPGLVQLDVVGSFAPYHGDGSYRAVIDGASASAAVRRLGPLPHDEARARLASWEVLVVPSIWEENNPLVINEALAAGVPVVASRIGGIPELIQDGVNGMLVEPGDEVALADVLARLARDRSLLTRLRARIRTPRPLDEAVAEARGTYEDLISRRAASAARVVPRGPVQPAAVVLHYGTPVETALAVRALRASESPLASIIVVDNDESPRVLDTGTIGVPAQVLRTGRNTGFAGGMNAGIRAALAAGADAVLLVNSDVIVPPDTTRMLCGALAAHPRAGIVGPVVLARGEPERIATLGLRVNRVTGRVRHEGTGQAFDPVVVGGWRTVDAVSGSLMMVRREVFERIGFFDEQYFFTFEEIELCLRAAAAGFECGVTGGAVAYHAGGGTLPESSPERFYFAARNHLRLVDAVGRDGRGPVRWATRGLVVALNVAHAVRRPGRGRARRLGATFSGVRDYWLGRFGPGPLS